MLTAAEGGHVDEPRFDVTPAQGWLATDRYLAYRLGGEPEGPHACPRVDRGRST